MSTRRESPHPVKTLRIRFVNRDNSAEHTQEFRYDERAAEYAHWWVEQVHEIEDPDTTPLDFDGPGLDAWTRLLGLHDHADLARAEPAMMQYRLYHLPAKLTHHARSRATNHPGARRRPRRSPRRLRARPSS